MFMKPYDHIQMTNKSERKALWLNMCFQTTMEHSPGCTGIQIILLWPNLVLLNRKCQTDQAKRYGTKFKRVMCERSRPAQNNITLPVSTGWLWLLFLVWAHQKGTMRTPVPRGEKGLTLAHMSASLREMADLPSSRRNTGPCMEKKRTNVKSVPNQPNQSTL